jgi:hypothetical protein
VTVWDVNSRSSVGVVFEAVPTVKALAWSPTQNTLIAMSEDGVLVRAQPAVVLSPGRAHPVELRAPAVSPNVTSDSKPADFNLMNASTTATFQDDPTKATKSRLQLRKPVAVIEDDDDLDGGWSDIDDEVFHFFDSICMLACFKEID